VKYPAPGKVKTRLARSVGDREAARLYKNLAEMNFREILKLRQSNVCDIVVVFDPPEKIGEIQRWLGGPCEYTPQSDGGLGARLTRAIQDAFRNGGKRVVVLGSDTLGLKSRFIEEAFQHLQSKDVVIGPAEDGGYYLIGLSSFKPELFQGIDWSTSKVSDQTMKIIQKLSLSSQALRPLEDLDEIRR
jgi:hypothetical protein